MRARAAVAVLLALLCAAVVAAALALLALLPARTADERLAADAVRLLAQREEVRTEVATADGSYAAHCAVLPRRRERFSDAGGRELLIEGPFARERIGGPNLPREVLHQAYLAGCPRLISRGVGRRIRRGQEVYAGATTFAGVSAHELVVLGGAADVRLVVDAQTLEPLGVRMGRSASASFQP